MLLGYAFMYNPIWFVVALWRRKTKVGMKPAYMQIVGMIGLTQNIRRTTGWALRMMFGRITRVTEPPRGPIPVHTVAGEPAPHGHVFVTVQSQSKTRIRLPVAG